MIFCSLDTAEKSLSFLALLIRFVEASGQEREDVI